MNFNEYEKDWIGIDDEEDFFLNFRAPNQVQNLTSIKTILQIKRKLANLQENRGQPYMSLSHEAN